MQWISLSLLSAVFLGVYALAKKTAVHENAVPPVLFLNVLTAAGIYTPIVLLSAIPSSPLAGTPLFVESISSSDHIMLASKSLLVGLSWTLALFGFKHLPISVSTPIRSTSPLWTILIAVAILGERPNAGQWVGIFVVLTAFFLLSQVGRTEGIHFHNNRWVGCMLAATLLGSVSALYDKYLLQRTDFTPATVQAWFSVYLVAVMLPLATWWCINERTTKPLQLRWSIPAIAITLLVADFLYFNAVDNPDALISVISPLRRTSVVIPFAYGTLCLAEKSWKPKAMCIALMLFGVVLVCQR